MKKKEKARVGGTHTPGTGGNWKFLPGCVHLFTKNYFIIITIVFTCSPLLKNCITTIIIIVFNCSHVHLVTCSPLLKKYFTIIIIIVFNCSPTTISPSSSSGVFTGSSLSKAVNVNRRTIHELCIISTVILPPCHFTRSKSVD